MPAAVKNEVLESVIEIAKAQLEDIAKQAESRDHRAESTRRGEQDQSGENDNSSPDVPDTLDEDITKQVASHAKTWRQRWARSGLDSLTGQ